MGELSIVEDGALAARDGRVVWVGPTANLPAWSARDMVDANGRVEGALRPTGAVPTFIEEIADLARGCRLLVEKKKKEDTRARRALLETAFDTVAALRGDFRRPPASPGPAAGTGPAPTDREEAGLLVWGRERNAGLLADSPHLTVVLTVAIAAVLLGLLYRLFF